MKVLQVNSVANIGSTGRIADGIGSLLLSEKNESVIAYGRYARKSSSTLIRIGGKVDYTMHALKNRITDKHGLYSANATRDFIKTITELNPDIIHLHNIHGYYLNYEIFFDFLKRYGRPVVWTLHDCWPFTGHCAYFDMTGCKKWEHECYDCPAKSSYPKSYKDNSRDNFFRKRQAFSSMENMTLVPVSYWLRDLLKDSFLKDYPTEVIHNGIDIDVFKPAESESVNLRTNGYKHIVLGVANIWDKRKGLVDIIKLRSMLPNDFLIVAIGVDRKVASKMPDGILCIERTDNVGQLAGYYSSADVFINPTYEDNYPTTILESISCGTPVITYNTGGCAESVDNGTGVIVNKGDLTAMKDAIINIVSEKTPEVRDTCREKAVRSFSDKICFKQYLELYKQIIKKNEHIHR